MVQKFEFLPDPDAKELPQIKEGRPGIVSVPKPYKIFIKEL